MRAIQIHQYGAADTLSLEDIATPNLQDHELLVAVRYSGVNPIDVKIRSGNMQGGLPKQFPFVPGWELAGIVEQVGASVTSFKPGDAVYSMPNFGQGGSYAAFVAINETEVAPKPETLTFAQAAAVPMVAGAAYTSLFKFGNLASGQRILIHGAAGAVGSFAVQMAKAAGAFVVGTATGEGIPQLLALGADDVIDYVNEDFATSEKAKGMDLVLDLVGGETLMRSFGLVKKGGLLLSTAMPLWPEKAAEAGIRADFVFTSPDSVMFRKIATLIDTGKLKVNTPEVLPLADAKKAHEMIENRIAKGKMVLDPNQ